MDAVMAALRSPDQRLRAYWNLVRERFVALLVLTAVGTFVGLLVGLTPAPVYSTTVSINVDSLPSGTTALGPSNQRRSIDSEAQVLTSDAVLTAAARSAEVEMGPSTLRSRLVVTAAPLSRVLRLKVTASAPGTAKTLAAAISSAFEQARSDDDSQQLRTLQASLDQRQDALRRQFAAPEFGASLSRDASRSLLRRSQALLHRVETMRRDFVFARPQTTTTVLGTRSESGFLDVRPRLFSDVTTGMGLGITVWMLYALGRAARPTRHRAP